LINTVMTDDGSTFQYNAGFYGGVFNSESSSVTLTNSVIKNNLGGEGGAIFSSGASTISITSVSFTENHALHNAGLHYHSSSSNTNAHTISYSLSTITTHSSKQSGGLFFIDNPNLTSMTLESITVTESTCLASGGVFYYN